MKKIFYKFIIFSLSIVYFSACAPLYVPNVVNTPMLTEKGDLNASLHAGLSGYDAQGAYALTENIAVMLNSSFMNSTSDSSNNYHKHIFVEAGAGYFKPLGEFGLFEVYSGYGLGKINSYQATGDLMSFADTYVNRFFVQPSFGFVSPYFEAAIAPRAVMAFVSQTTGRQTGFFIEPTLVLKAGSPNLKLTSQIGLSYMLNQYETSFFYQPFIFSIGLQYSVRGGESERKY